MPLPPERKSTLSTLADLTPYPNAVSATHLDIRNNLNQANPDQFPFPVCHHSYPLLYIPFPQVDAGGSINLYFYDDSGNTTRFTQVDSFDANALNEFILVGNCAVCLS